MAAHVGCCLDVAANRTAGIVQLLQLQVCKSAHKEVVVAVVLLL